MIEIFCLFRNSSGKVFLNVKTFAWSLLLLLNVRTTSTHFSHVTKVVQKDTANFWFKWRRMGIMTRRYVRNLSLVRFCYSGLNHEIIGFFREHSNHTIASSNRKILSYYKTWFFGSSSHATAVLHSSDTTWFIHSLPKSNLERSFYFGTAVTLHLTTCQFGHFSVCFIGLSHVTFVLAPRKNRV